jgi:hypothetical protein
MFLTRRLDPRTVRASQAQPASGGRSRRAGLPQTSSTHPHTRSMLGNITTLALAISSGGGAPSCPQGTAPIQAGRGWSGNLNAGGTTDGAAVAVCAGRGPGSPITAVRAVGAQSAANTTCSAGFTSAGEPWKSAHGYTALCFSRDASLGPAINTLEGKLTVGGLQGDPTGCPAPLTAVDGHYNGPAPPPPPLPNATVCHGYTCTEQGQLCPLGSPGTSDRDYRCCPCKDAPHSKCSCTGPLCWLEGNSAGAPAPTCSSSGPPQATSCPGFVCTPEQQGMLCKKGTPGAADR